MAGDLPSYPDFLAIQRRLAWDADAIDLGADARGWAALGPRDRGPLRALLGTFALGEDGVARDIAPFARAGGNDARAECFDAQQRDEERHARAFTRIEHEVAGESLRPYVPAALRDLLEQRLPAAAAALDGGGPLADGVALYHGVIEGVVFLAGQDALLDRLGPTLPGCTEIVRRTQRDERWHVAFGMRVLADLGAFAAEHTVPRLLREAELALAGWGELIDRPTRERTLRALQRRLAYSSSKSVARAADSIAASSRSASATSSAIS